jgi:5-methylcytosine-specific restriction endonuclease McrA
MPAASSFEHWGRLFNNMKPMNDTHYVKLFNGLIHSSIWKQPHETFKVFITFLLMKDSGGVVFADNEWIASVARVTVEQADAAILYLTSPDPESRDDANEGRRIEPIDDERMLWLVLNHEKYRDMLPQSVQRAVWRSEKANYRKGKSSDEFNCPPVSAGKKAYANFLNSDFWRDLTQRKKQSIGKCEECGATESLESHHVFYRGDWFDTQLEDLKVLCASCHSKTHNLEPTYA